MRFLAILFTALLFLQPAQAFDITKMTPEEEAAFGDAVRQYLLDHPDVLIEVINKIEQQRQEAQASADVAALEDHHDAIYADDTAWVGGNPDGDVTLVEFLDYKCGYCRQAHPEVTALVKNDGNIRYVVKEFPILGEQSLLAARFALSVKQVAGDDAYGAMHDRLMTFRGDFTPATLQRLSDEAGLDTAAVMSGMKSPEVEAIIAANHELAKALQIDGTPGFVLKDQLLRGYVPADALSELVRRARG